MRSERCLRRSVRAPPDPARLLTHIPDPRQVMRRYCGWYARRIQGMRQRQAAGGAEVDERVAFADAVNWSLRAARYRRAELPWKFLFVALPLTPTRCVPVRVA